MIKTVPSIVLFLILQFVIANTLIAQSTHAITSESAKADSLEKSAYSFYYTNSDSSILLYTQAYNIYKDDSNQEGEMRCLSLLSKLYQNKGLTDTAIVLAYKAITIGEQNAYDTLLAETYLRMGNYFMSISKFKKAKAFFLKTIVLDFPFTKNGAQGAIGQLYLQQGSLDSAKYYMVHVLDYYENQDSTKKSNMYNRGSLHGSLGVLAFQQNKLEKGLAHFKESLRISKKISNDNNTMNCLINLSIGYDYLDQPNKSEAMLKEALLFADSLDYNNFKLSVYNVYTEHYEERGQYKEAFYWTTRYHNMQDSLDKVDFNKVIYENELKYQNKIKEEEHKRLMVEEEHKRLILWLTILASSLFFIFITIYLFRRLKTTIQERKYFEKQSKLNEVELIEVRNHLSYLNDHLAEQNQRILDLQKQKRDSAFNDDTIIIGELENIRILRNEDWEEYQKLFQQLYPSFLDSIIEKHPHLSEGDKRQLIMIKLEYSKKKSATILGISPESVKKARQRLSKKLDLDDVTGLDSFVGGVAD